MLNVEYPDPSFSIKTENGRRLIFDPLRRKWLLLTPEEWVRQNFVQHLIQVKNYPAALIAQEKIIHLGDLRKRFDILIYDRRHHPWMMIECKAPSVALNENVLHQLLRYHISVPAGLLVITNGSTSYGWEKKERNLVLISELPAWNPAK